MIPLVDILKHIWVEHPIWITWGTVGAYVTFIFLKGVAKAKKIGDSDDFLVAGRNVGWFFLFCTMGATVIGGGCSIGAMGKTYEWGVLMLIVSTGWYIHFIFSGLVVAPKFRLAKLYTVAGYFGHRFGEGPRFACFILTLVFSVLIIAAQMAAFGFVLATALPGLANAVTGLFGLSAVQLAIIIGGILVVVYSTAGGLLAVIYTDFFQFLVLFAGFIITLLMLVPDIATNWSSVSTSLPTEFLQLTGGKGWLFLITTFLALLLGETFAPGYATRYCIGKDVRQTKIGIAGVGAFLALSFPVVLFFIAVGARMHFPNIEDAQMALPMVVKELNNPLIGGIMIGALLSAVMSSADSALNSATAIFVKDLFEHYLGWKEKGDKRILKLARICSGALGLTAIIVAVLWSDIIGLLLLTYDVWAPAIILPVIFGVFSKDHSQKASKQILITMVTATTMTLLYKFLPLPFLNPIREIFNAAVFGVMVSIVTFIGLRYGQRDRRQIEGKPLTEDTPQAVKITARD